MKRYILKIKTDILMLSREIIHMQIGTRELTGENDGDVVKYLKSVGLTSGQPYCMAGQYYCFKLACQTLGLPTTEIPIIRTGSTVACFHDAKQKGILSDSDVHVDDLIFWKYKNRYAGHVERVVELLGGNTVKTVGFNTSNSDYGNQRDGDGVYYRKRKLTNLGSMFLYGIVGFDWFGQQWPN